MTEIERKALALLNEVAKEMGLSRSNKLDLDLASHRALLRAIERHEAFAQDVSDAVELANMRVKELKRNTSYIVNHMQQYIIPKPVDPLVEAMAEAFPNYNLGDNLTHLTDHSKWLRAAIEKRGGKIVWGEGA